MDKKKLFMFSQALNLFFYVILGVSVYRYQTRHLQHELVQYYAGITDVLHSELTDKKEFYQRWSEHLYDKGLTQGPQRDTFFNLYNIKYAGKFNGDELAPLPPFTQKPPFPPSVLKSNNNFLFYRDAENFYYTYLLSDSHVVVHGEDSSLVTKRALNAQAQLIIAEKESGTKATVLFTNLKTEQANNFVRDYPDLESIPLMVQLENQTFLLVPKFLVHDNDFKQVIVYAYSIKNFFFTPSLAMVILLLALFCVSSYLLYFGYLKTRD